MPCRDVGALQPSKEFLKTYGDWRKIQSSQSWMQLANAFRHSGSMIPKRSRNRSLANREFFGRAAGRRYSELAIGRIFGLVRPPVWVLAAKSSTASPKPCQLVEPPAVKLKIPDENLLSSRSRQACWTILTVASAMSRAQVGAPTWSATMDSSCRSCAILRIVVRKLRPRAAYTQLVRKMR